MDIVKEKILMKSNFEDRLSDDLVNISEKTRSNLFAWRGQFSPQLIEALINNYAEEKDVMYDPFCGSGTLLLESAILNHDVYGTELNPAAFGLASIYKLTKVAPEIVDESIGFIDELINDFLPLNDLFSDFKGRPLSDLKKELVNNLDENRNSNIGIILNALIIGLDFEQKQLTHEKLQLAWMNLKLKIKNLPYTQSKVELFLGDARQSKLKESTVDFVITSPPYINVFNYHQNYRKSVEATGFNVLDVAKSEIGANRKFRSNRYLTVIQYAMDIYQVFEDLRRVCKKNAKVIFIVGRESSVRKTSFTNAKLLTEVASKLGFQLIGEQPRMFKNKFGQDIYEEILKFKQNADISIESIEEARKIAIKHLESALKYAPTESLSDLEDAILKSGNVQPSKIYTC